MGKRSKKLSQAEEEKDEDKIMGIPRKVLILAVIIAFGGGSFVFFTYTNTPVNLQDDESEFIKEIRNNTYEGVPAFGNTTEAVALNITRDTSEVVAMVFGSATIDDIMNATIEGVEEISGELWGNNLVFKFRVTTKQNATENINDSVGYYLGKYKFYNGYFGKFTTDVAPGNMNEIYILSEQELDVGDIFIANAGNVLIKKKDDQVAGVVAVDGYKIQSGDTGIDAIVVNIAGADFSGKINSSFNLKSFKDKVNASGISYTPPKISIDSAADSIIDELNNLDGVRAEITGKGNTTITLNMTNITENETESYINSGKTIIKNILNIPGKRTDEKIIIDEYSQFDCPACAMAVPVVHKVEEDYPDKIVVNFKHFAFHEGAQKPAEASECARDQGKFREYHDKLFENQNALAGDNLTKYAEELALDMEKFNECLDSGEKEAIVKRDMDEASSRGAGGTPAIFVDGKQISPWSVLPEAIKERIMEKEEGLKLIDNKFIIDYAITTEMENKLYEAAEGIESIEIETGKTEIIFNNSLEEIKSIIGDDEIYELIEGELSFKIARDSDMELVKGVLEDAEIKDIKIEKAGFVSLPKLILISGMVTPLQDRPGNYINENYTAILKPGTKIGDKIKVEIGATIQTMGMPDGSTRQTILGFGSAVEMDEEAIKKLEEEAKMKEQEKEEEKEQEKEEETPKQEEKMKIAILKTNKGIIKFKLYTVEVPKTTENFIKLANDGFYPGLVFHRVANLDASAPETSVIQGGGFYPDGTQKQSPYGAINLEIHPDLIHDDGAVAMARTSDPDSATSQFYICDGPQHFLDGQYAVFGQVIEGMDIVRSIASVETTTRHQQYGNWPVEDVIINNITIEEEA